MDSLSKPSGRKRLSRSSIAALSALALAAGTLVTAPSFMSPQSATAAELSGGIRDKSGAVEKADQKASDLPAGSCVVESGDPDGSQAGFTWGTLEPSATSPSKTAWGIGISFDNSKDRTFVDWSFTNSGRLGAYLNTAPVSSMNIGQTLTNDKAVVTHKADENIDITGRGAQRNINLLANLTEDKVGQYAQASSANPVRYAWKSDYTQENPSLHATQGSSALFSAVVNPWPSENIECNPITVSWENFQKHVIVPGEETKVGTINVPAVANGGKDDSLSRMVVEAYDGNGKFIGTTDPAASGGEKMLRIDDSGDIYFTWPKYRGTNLADDKNVNFSVLAKPRTVDQLQAAGGNNDPYGEPKTFESSNSLDRYSTANVIDSKAFSLDDTEYHNPQYDKTDASIISGVDSETGPLATEPQKVVFTQTPDLIKELEKKKADGGFEATVRLDDKYVYEGWTVEMDDDYNVTVTAPENPKPDTFARPKITVEYSNGSTDVLELLVVVDPNHTQVTDLVRPGLSKGKVNEEISAQILTKSIMKGHSPVHPAKFEIDPDSVPEGWIVTVDNTGKVTAKADDSVAPGTIITPKVKATYPDQTTDEIEVQFQAFAEIKIPDYDTVTGKPKTTVSLLPTIPERGLSGNTTDEAPDRYTFENGQTETVLKDKDGNEWKVSIDENTGEITTTIPSDAEEGDQLDVPVMAHYKDGNKFKPQKVTGTVVVIKGDLKAEYNVQVTSPDQAVKHQVEGAPKGSTYSFGKNADGSPITEQEVDGWKYQIDPNTGEVTATPPADAKPGDKKTITVTVDAPGDLTTDTPVTTVVKLMNNWEANPVIPPKTVYPGDTVTSPLAIEKPKDIEVAKDKPYEIAPLPDYVEATGETNKFGNPTYTLKTDHGDWIVSLDDKGNVISTAPETAKPGDKIEVPVTVTYEDGSKDITSAVVNVVKVPEREIPFKVEYKYDDTVPAGTYNVKTEGQPGAETMNADGTWTRILDPVNEVVVVGTKPAESAKDVTWTVPIPYPTEVRENSKLAPGETRVVQEGENGEKTYTAKFTAQGDKAEVAEAETTKEPKKRIIEYGPRLGADELVTKVEKPVPFETEIVFDDTLEKGKQVVDQTGELGTDVVTSTQKIKDGKPDGDPTVTTERTKEPVKQIIRVGTKCPPAAETVEWIEKTPFKVEVRVNPELKPGEKKVIQEGKQGEIKHTVTVKNENGQVSKEESSEKISDPVDHIVEVGPNKTQTELTDTHKEQIPYDTIIEYDPNLEAGKMVEDQPGELGEKEITKTWQLENGEPVGDPETSEKIIKEPQTRKLRVGTKCACEAPTEPSEPSEPSEPTDPTEPAEPDEPTDKPSNKPVEPVKPGHNPSNNPSKPGKTKQVRKGSYKSKNPTYARSSADSLARTGADVAKTAYVGMGMIGAGLVLAVARRRNRRD